MKPHSVFKRETVTDLLDSVVFLEKLESLDPFKPDLVAALDKLYGLSKTDNSEIKLRFYEIALNAGPEYAEEAAGEIPAFDLRRAG